jgi:hypothetical protein
MKLTTKHVVTGLAAAGLMAGALTAGGVALASTGSAPSFATSAPATSSYGPGAGNCGTQGMRSGRQPVMTAVADYLGLSLTQLRTQLRSGTRSPTSPRRKASRPPASRTPSWPP